MTVSSPILVIIFSGVSHIGWMISLTGVMFWNYIIIYFVILFTLIVFIKRNTLDFSLSLINAGGLPPFSGFALKIKAIIILEIGLGVALLAARALALVSYTRLIVHTKLTKRRLWHLAALFFGYYVKDKDIRIISNNEMTKHPFHIVDIRPWPLTGALGRMFLTRGIAAWMNKYDDTMIYLGLVIIVLTIVQW